MNIKHKLAINFGVYCCLASWFLSVQFLAPLLQGVLS